MTDTPKRAAIYARVSTDSQSTKAQENELKAYAVATAGSAEATLQLSASYTDVSGTVQTKTSGTATPFDSTGANVQLDTLLQCSPSTNVTFTVTESGGATYAVTVNLILN